MAQPAVFRWHEAARLFAGQAEITRPSAPTSKGFCALANSPTVENLSALATALATGDSFCVAQDPLPKDTHANPAHFLTFTGGSSAKPKIIRRSMASWIASFGVNATQFTLTPQDSLAVLGALSHSLALYGVVEGLYLGFDAYQLAAMPPQAQAGTMRQSHISVLYATPTQLRLLSRTGTSLPDLRLILCGGGALDAATSLNIQNLCPNAALHQFYGAAETSFITMTNATTPQGAQGRAYPGVDLRILDETGAETSGVGEVWVRSPYLFDGYASNTAPIARTPEGYISVGEIGRLDPQGNLHLTGRTSRRVTIADQTIYPDAIEAHLMAQPEMPPCTLLPIADELRGHRLVAVIEGPTDAALAQSLRQSCRTAFGALASPARVLFIEALPLLPSGKTDLSALAVWLEDQT